MSSTKLKSQELSSAGSPARRCRENILSQIWLLPNLISLGRIILILPIVYLFNNPSPVAFWAAVSLIFISYVSDYLDGFLARWLAQQSKLGKMLDPIADKVWTMVMVYLLYLYRDLPPWIMIVIIIRDVSILHANIRFFIRSGELIPGDEIGRKYTVLLGLMVLGYAMRLPYILWLAYFLIVMSGITWYRYYIKYRAMMNEFDRRTNTVKEVKEVKQPG